MVKRNLVSRNDKKQSLNDRLGAHKYTRHAGLHLKGFSKTVKLCKSVITSITIRIIATFIISTVNIITLISAWSLDEPSTLSQYWLLDPYDHISMVIRK